MRKLVMALAITLWSFGGAAVAEATVISVPVPFKGSSLYAPDDGRAHAGVLLLPGGEEAVEARVLEAQGLAAQGFAAFVFSAVDSDISRAYEALRWLRASPFVNQRPVALYGVARGAEHALVLGVYLAKHSGLRSPNAIAVHAPSSRIRNEQDSPRWNWQGEELGLEPETEIRLDRYSGDLFMTHGIEDQQQSVEASRSFEETLRKAGSAVSSFTHSTDSTASPRVFELTRARAHFHYFEGQGAVFSASADAARMKLLHRFLRATLGQ